MPCSLFSPWMPMGMMTKVVPWAMWSTSLPFAAAKLSSWNGTYTGWEGAARAAPVLCLRRCPKSPIRGSFEFEIPGFDPDCIRGSRWRWCHCCTWDEFNPSSSVQPKFGRNASLCTWDVVPALLIAVALPRDGGCGWCAQGEPGDSRFKEI